MKKMYSAFLSSVYESLLDEREAAINTLLKFRIFPICMEHFVVADNRRFEDLKQYIDESDFMVLLLGKEYGSCDTDGVGFTEKEYNYASEKKNLDIVVLEMPELTALRAKPPRKLSESQRRQIAFADRTMAIRIRTHEEIKQRLASFFSQRQLEDSGADVYAGWMRGITAQGLAEEEEELFAAHPEWKIAGRCFHVHLCSNNPSYVRMGTANVTQTFDGNGWDIEIRAENYALTFREETQSIHPRSMNRTTWTGNYRMEKDGTLKTGIYCAIKEDSDNFGQWLVKPGTRYGLHDFKLLPPGLSPYFMSGSFHDCVQDDINNSGKAGRIFFFRTQEERLKFLLDECADTLRANAERR